MKSITTISCKLNPTLEQAAKIDATLGTFADACNWVHGQIPFTLRNQLQMQALVYTVKILPALLSCAEGTGQVTVCQVFTDKGAADGSELLDADARELERSLGHLVETAPLYAEDVCKTLIDFANSGKFDGIILGASRDSLLRQVVHGNIPETLTRNSDCTVVLVRT